MCKLDAFLPPVYATLSFVLRLGTKATMRKTQPQKEVLALMLAALLLVPLSVACAQDQIAPEEDIVESFGAIVDEVEQDLREGQTNAEAGRNFLEVILDFFRNIALGAYDAVIATISDSDDPSVTLEEFNQLLTGTTLDQLVEALGTYSESTISSTTDVYGNVTIITELRWINEDGSEAVAVLNNGTLVETNQTGLV